eukprot:CAMPEP_0172330660 /NCGR_PEP_ID=MMETSP1058-20130122/61517_1 /TAXON_ID=83371 /ORGANISM="Detonula confervacea, Strain CCMP 353" /LENGTH=620 /DNA_ID=CAMNT_0013047885 /DNA_START=14 /DNA_END=1876 /DNA_ORIENTATION=-
MMVGCNKKKTITGFRAAALLLMFAARVECVGGHESRHDAAGDDGAQFAGKLLRARRDLFDQDDGTNDSRGRVGQLGMAVQPDAASIGAGAESSASYADCVKSMDIQLYFNSSIVKFQPDVYACKSGQTYVGSSSDGKVHITLVPSRQSHAAEANMLDANKNTFHASVTEDATGAVYSIAPNANGEMIVTTRYQEDYPPELDPDEDFDPNERALLLADFQEPDTFKSHHRAVQEASIFDVLVPWTAAAECRNSNLPRGCTLTSMTESNIRGLIDLAVQETNVAYSLSGVNVVLNLAHAYRTNYVEGSTREAYSTALNDLTFDGNVATKRAEFGADVVALIIGAPGFCGIAHLGPRKERMFSVTNQNCATGNYSFGHEIGHNLGCNHDKGTKGQCGTTNYNYGYRDSTAGFRSILAYGCKDGECDTGSGRCVRVQRFSNNEFNYPDSTGEPIGTATIDNARQINDVRVEVAAYFDIPSLPPTTGPTSSPTTLTAIPTTSPTKQPTSSPITTGPTSSPTTLTAIPTTSPTKQPTSSPINRTNAPSISPTKQPTQNPVSGSPTVTSSPTATALPTSKTTSKSRKGTKSGKGTKSTKSSKGSKGASKSTKASAGVIPSNNREEDV